MVSRRIGFHGLFEFERGCPFNFLLWRCLGGLDSWDGGRLRFGHGHALHPGFNHSVDDFLLRNEPSLLKLSCNGL